MSVSRMPLTSDGKAAGGPAVFRRSFTLPPKLSTPTKQRSTEIGAAEGIETLYVHPSSKVVSFSTGSSSRPSSSSSSAGFGVRKDTPGTLPWTHPLERTLAAGPLEIYRVPGSVSFLHSGSLLHAILPRSQCWCVDGVSKFAFRVLADTYYRIELPGDTEEDLAEVKKLKATLQKVLHYERTACPFKRGFSVDLPEAPEIPQRRSSRRSIGPAKRWTLNGVWRPEGAIDEDRRSSRSSSVDASDDEIVVQKTATLVRTDQTGLETNPSDETEPLDEVKPLDEMKTLNDTKPLAEAVSQTSGSSLRPGNFAGVRSVTAPPQLTLRSSPPSKLLPAFGLDSAIQESLPEPNLKQLSCMPQSPRMPPTPESMPDNDHSPYEETTDQQDLETTEDEVVDDRRAESSTPSRLYEFAKAGENQRPTETNPAELEFSSEEEEEEAPKTPLPEIRTPSIASDSEDDAWGELHTPAKFLRQRRPYKPSTTRSASSDGSSTRLYRTSSSESQRAMAEDLVRKTCAIFLGPPAHLVTLMLKIASRIANGAFNMTIQSPAGSHRRVPGSWDLSEDEADWGDIDDYRFSLDKKSTLEVGKTWSIE